MTGGLTNVAVQMDKLGRLSNLQELYMTIKGLEQAKEVCYKCKLRTYSFDYREYKGKQKAFCMECLKELK